MSRFSARELALLLVALLLALGGAVAGALDSAPAAVAVSLALAVVAVLLVDVRRRLRLLGKSVSRLTASGSDAAEQARADRDDVRRRITALGSTLPPADWAPRQEEHARRTIAAVEALRLEARDRARDDRGVTEQAAAQAAELLAQQERVLRRVTDVRTWTARQATERALDLQQVEALLQLHLRVDPPGFVPLSGRWAMDPVGLLATVQLVAGEKPSLVVELGSGTSTVWLALALRDADGSRVVSLDHEASYAELTRAALAGQPGAERVEVRLAPLEHVDVPGAQAPWYSPAALDDLHGIDLLMVDGPPQATGDRARYPAVPALVDRLADRAWVLLDDAERESDVLEAWLAEVPGLTRQEVSAFSSRQALLRYERPGT